MIITREAQSMSTTIRQDVAALETATGITVTAKDASTDWLSLMRDGVIVKLHVRRWRAKSRLTPQDLGLPEDALGAEEWRHMTRLGEQYLMPAEVVNQLNSIEAAARTFVTKSGYDTFWGTFVPVTGFAQFRAGLEEYRQRYLAARDQIDQDYPLMRVQVEAYYRSQAIKAWDRMLVLAPAVMAKYERLAWQQAFVDRVMARIPDRQQVIGSFGFDLDLSYIPLPSLMAEEVAATEAIKAEQDIARSRIATERALLKAQEENERAILAARRQAAETEAEGRRRLMAEMHKEVVGQAREEALAQIKSFSQTIQAQLAGAAYDGCYDLLAKIQDTDAKFLHPRSLVKARNLAERIEALNFTGDRTAQEVVDKLRAVITGKEAEQRSLPEIQTALRAILTVTRQELLDIGETPRSLKDLGMPDDPGAEILDLARRQLRPDALSIEVGVEMLDARQGRAL